MSTPLRVLILEDQLTDAELMVHELRRAGFAPYWHRVETEPGYLAHLDPPPDVILADYNMPEFSAPRALSLLLERGIDVPFIVVTGSISEEVAVECMKQGAADYLLKDRLARLGPAVVHALEQQQLRREKRKADELAKLQSAVLEAAANAILITDRDGRIAWVNPAFTRLTGYTLQEVWGQNPRILKSGGHDSAFYQKMWEQILSGQEWHGEVINRRKDGSLYAEEQTITPVKDERGEIAHFIGIKQDITERRRAEEEVRSLSKFPAENPQPVLRLDHEGRVLYANEASQALLREWGCAVGQPAPKFWGDLVQEALSSQERKGVDVACGDLVYSFLLRPVPEAGYGNLYGRDITERRRAEDALRASETRYRRLFESAKDGILILTASTGEVINVNPFLLAMLGYSREEILGKLLWELSPFRDIVGNQQAFLELQTKDYNRHEHLPLETKAGGAVAVEFVSNVYQANGGQVIQCNIRDITDRKRAEDALRQYMERLRALREIDQAILTARSPQAIAEGSLRHLRRSLPCQRASIALFDFTAQTATLLAADVEGETRIVAGTILSLDEYGIAEILRQGKVNMVEDIRSLSQPTPVIHALQAEGMRTLLSVPLSVQGSLIGSLNLWADTPRAFSAKHVDMASEVADQLAVAIQQARLHEQIQRHAAELEVRVQDRTRELATANQQLQVISQHKSEFLATMSHELRTPLNSILGFSQLLLEQTASVLSEKQRRHLGHIHNSGQHLLQLISDILDLSKVEAGKTVLDSQVLRVAPLLEDILVIARGLANKKAQSIETQIAPDLPSLRADPVRFKQILFNLLSNAVKFTPERGTITLSAKAVPGIANCRLQIADWKESGATIQSEIANVKSEIGDFLEIAVTDTGIGIKAEDLPRLFQEFVQLEAGRAQGSEGTGLGLALTKKLVELHGGRIWAASPGEGQGSTFTVVLPFTGPGEREA